MRSREIRVLFDHQILGWLRYGGIARYYYELSNHLAVLPGVDVEVVAPLYVNDHFRRDSRLRPTGVRLPDFPRAESLAMMINARVAPAMIARRRGVDIFHETYYSMDRLCPRATARIVTVFDMIHERFADDFGGVNPTAARKAAAVRRADHVICISDSTRRDLIELLGVPPEQTSVVHLGFSLGAASDAAPVRATRPFLLYVGQRWGYKNFAGLLRAYASSEVLTKNFAIVCFGGGRLTREETDLSAALGIAAGRVVHMAGDDEMLNSLYRTATVFVYPSLYEGFGLPPLEAMALGCPVASSNASSMPEVLGDAAAYFNPADVDDMRAAIESVVGSPTYSVSLIGKGRERITHFGWDRCARQTLSVYERALKG